MIINLIYAVLPLLSYVKIPWYFPDILTIFPDTLQYFEA